jgi:hypothetical protein
VPREGRPEVGGEGRADAGRREQLLHVLHDALVGAGLQTRGAEVVDERVPFVRENRNSDIRVAGMREEGSDVGAHEAGLVDLREHVEAGVEGEGGGGEGEDVNGGKVVESLHPRANGSRQCLHCTGRC